ncbi:MAG: hypothetical protein M3Y50_14745 [Acidobacteriota bacterium]|nr:hypothetical protein [Acidobacteriota bacterium]
MNPPSSTPSNSLVDSFRRGRAIPSPENIPAAPILSTPILSDRMYRIAALTAGIFLLATLL